MTNTTHYMDLAAEVLAKSAHSPYTLDYLIAEAIQSAVAAERERCAQVAHDTTWQPMDYIGWSPGPAADDRARKIAAAIRALD